MKKLIFLTLFVYSFLGAISFHTDRRLILSYGQLSKGKGWNIYQILQNNQTQLPDFHYPPTNFWSVKVEKSILSLVGGSDFDRWLAMDNLSAFRADNIVYFNLVSKLILFGLVFLCGLLIYKLALKIQKDKKLALLSAALWFLNPITLYSVVMMGQNDLLAITPFLFGLLFYWTHPYLAFGLFGLAASFKSFPLIWAIFLAFIYPTKSNKSGNKLLFVLTSLLVYALPMLPFLTDPSFRESVLASGLINRIFSLRLDLGFGDGLLIVPILLALLLFISVEKKRINLYFISRLLMTVSMVLLFFTHFHPQWFVWILPFWILFWVYLPSEKRFLHGLIASLSLAAYFLIVILYNDKFLTWGIFLPVNPDLINVPVIREYLLARNIDIFRLNDLSHSFLAAVGLFYIASIKQKIIPQKFFLKQINIFEKIKLSKLGKLLTAILLSLFLEFLILATVFLVPSISRKSSCSSERKSVSFWENKNSFSGHLDLDQPGLYKLEIAADNQALLSNDLIDITVTNNGRLVTQNLIQAFNIGNPGVIRIDLPSDDYQDLDINLKLKNEVNEFTGKHLNLSVTGPENQICIDHFYRSGFGLRFNEAWSWMVTNWFLLLIMIPSLFLAI